MADFAVTVERLTIEPHPNADAIEIARVGDYQSIVRKGQFETGDLAVYIPEAALVPEDLLKVMGLEGKLSGSAKNRVKAIKLRGVLSQGLIYPVDRGVDAGGPFIFMPTDDGIGAYIPVAEGDDVTEKMGITKYEPKVPSQMAGKVRPTGLNSAVTIKYDINNLKRHPHVFIEGEEVVVTEKIHGTFMMVGIIPDELRVKQELDSRIVVSSKGLAARGFIFDHQERDNVYMQAVIKLGLGNKLLARFGEMPIPTFLLGEVFGRGVQDLHYGGEAGDVQFRAFDIACGDRNDLVFANDSILDHHLEAMEIDRVPVLYRGPYSKDVVLELTDGEETVSGKTQHMREGVVIKPTIERMDARGNRVIYKSVSERYLLRKNATEFA